MTTSRPRFLVWACSQCCFPIRCESVQVQVSPDVCGRSLWRCVSTSCRSMNLLAWAPAAPRLPLPRLSPLLSPFLFLDGQFVFSPFFFFGFLGIHPFLNLFKEPAVALWSLECVPQCFVRNVLHWGTAVHPTSSCCSAMSTPHALVVGFAAFQSGHSARWMLGHSHACHGPSSKGGDSGMDSISPWRWCDL